MSKPFQFSMRRMFLVVTWLCIAAWGFSTGVNSPYEANWVLWPISFVAAGAGLGAIAGKSLSGAAWGLLLAILIGLLMPVAIHRGPTSSPQARTSLEIAALDGAFKAYKEKHGAYPPSDFFKLDDTNSPQYKALAHHIATAFPRSDVETEIAAIKKLGVKSPAQALCFWLGGFCEDPVHPVSGLQNGPPEKRELPLIELDTARLRYPAGENTVPVYVPFDGQDAPYLYFSSVNYATQSLFSEELKQGGRGTAKPYMSDKAAGEFINPKSFQIISAGADGDFGGGAGSFPSGAGYKSGDNDNLTNFSDKSLGDSIPE